MIISCMDGVDSMSVTRVVFSSVSDSGTHKSGFHFSDRLIRAQAFGFVQNDAFEIAILMNGRYLRRFLTGAHIDK